MKTSNVYMNLLFTFMLSISVLFSASLVCASQAVEKKSPLKQTGWVYGFATGISSEPYIDLDNNPFFFPTMGYQGEKLRIFGPYLSYQLLSLHNLKITSRFQPRLTGFKASDGLAFSGMDKRSKSIDAGIGLESFFYTMEWRLSFLRDLLGRSDGLEANVSVAKPIKKGPFIIGYDLNLMLFCW